MPGQRTVCSGKSGISIAAPLARVSIGGPDASVPESSPPRARGAGRAPAAPDVRRPIDPRRRPPATRGRVRRRTRRGLRREHLVATLAHRLGLVHRDVRVAEQVVDVGHRRQVDRDADAGADIDRRAGDLDRRLERREEPLRRPSTRERRRPGCRGAGRRTRRRRAAPRGPSRAAPSRIRSATVTSSSSPAAWPRLSLTVLKSSRSRKRAATDPGRGPSGQRRLGLLDEPAPIGEAGQRVVERLVAELRLERPGARRRRGPAGRRARRGGASTSSDRRAVPAAMTARPAVGVRARS